ncbi:uncharacterized protein LOC130630060 [Hydractinia symbiolongicarpus]|uniref:uncharacterized protein LOC130630060 n=1 Tax=Hydractinia symbiolongicarpus TaxID=13093 RepID=UPI00254EB535|nr:uncharacterized protein LOC130630060 [Hydractinia symbiolongicarpus]
MASSVILTPTNDGSLLINDQVLALLPDEEKTYFSADDVVCYDEEERNQYPVEFLHSITPSGMPPHCLKLKSGVIVMLLGNININKGLCNGTRLIVKHLNDNCVDAEVLTGNAIGDRVLIPRLELAPSHTEQDHLKMLKLALSQPSNNDALMGNAHFYRLYVHMLCTTLLTWSSSKE